LENVMPRGAGTYGSKKGRPKKKAVSKAAKERKIISEATNQGAYTQSAAPSKPDEKKSSVKLQKSQAKKYAPRKAKDVKAKAKQRSNVSGVGRQVAQVKSPFPKAATLFGSTHDQTKAQVKKLTKKKVAPAKPKKTRVAIRPGSPASTAVSIAKSVKAPHDYGADAVDKYLSMTKSVTDAVRRKAKKGRKKFVAATGLKIR